MAAGIYPFRDGEAVKAQQERADLCQACFKLAAFKHAPTYEECTKCFEGNYTDRRFIRKDTASRRRKENG
jgi:hypothetical protein